METASAKTRRMTSIRAALARAYPEALCELDVTTPFEVLVATILSAQCTDKLVNTVTPALFAACPTPERMAQLTPEQIEPYIRRLGLFRNKARHLAAASRVLVERFGGTVPASMDDLLVLPGVGRKTANCVRVNAYGKPGIMVDTHCKRLAGRLGLTEERDPDRIEADLGALMPRKAWGAVSHRLILHGRRVCHARTPACGECCLRRWCPSAKGMAGTASL